MSGYNSIISCIYFFQRAVIKCALKEEEVIAINTAGKDLRQRQRSETQPRTKQDSEDHRGATRGNHARRFNTSSWDSPSSSTLYCPSCPWQHHKRRKAGALNYKKQWKPSTTQKIGSKSRMEALDSVIWAKARLSSHAVGPLKQVKRA